MTPDEIRTLYPQRSVYRCGFVVYGTPPYHHYLDADSGDEITLDEAVGRMRDRAVIPGLHHLARAGAAR